jgi:hypothetical protein
MGPRIMIVGFGGLRLGRPDTDGGKEEDELIGYFMGSPATPTCFLVD